VKAQSNLDQMMFLVHTVLGLRRPSSMLLREYPLTIEAEGPLAYYLIAADMTLSKKRKSSACQKINKT
jgi:hypothetical protein